ncbi:efflux RND transporter periplasmic adaptor subunit [Labrys monachus]|uniref:RND family efflux transporter MFP subunit n=1 Tax=Labrys monachus TaxID=217067 RepID=A0ABU0FK55_9HYPH|nr:efflux RND transporter periplasmic adaptor subunit [Labrys monachus]MDQ0394727.1 RND family efflux transporter MFP subunit [Labrys monachus]
MSAVEKQRRPEHGLEPNDIFGDAGGTPPAGSTLHAPAPRRSKVRTVTVTLLVLVLAAAAAAAAFMWLRPMLEAPAGAAVAVVAPPPSITIVHAVTGPITENTVVTGNLVPREEIMVSPQVDGYAIDQIMVEEGDRVTEGQVLARLSRTSIDTSLAQNTAQLARAEASIAQAKSSIAEAQANKDQAESAFARSRALQKSGNATEDTLEQREAAAKMADARLDAARHSLAVAEADRNLAVAQRDEMMVRLAHTQIQAPAAGIVSRRTARIGAVVSAAGEALFRIIRDGDIELEADVPETTLARLRVGMKAEVITAAREQPYAAHVRLVAPEVSTVTRLGRVRLAIDAAPGLTVGAFGRAKVEIASRTGVLVPQSAILYSEDGPTVQVVRDSVVSTRAVTLGLRTERQAEIARGVASGDAVVATAGTFVRDGDRITPMEATSPPGAE